MKRALTVLLTLVFLLALSPNHSSTFGQAPTSQDPLEDVDDDAEVTRVARLSFVAGDVSFLRAGVSEWAAAVENLPLLAGDQIYTASGARAEIQLARGSYIRLAESTSLTIADLSDTQSQFEVTSGTAIFRVERFASAFQRFEVDTPNSALVLKADGLYRVEVRSDAESEVIVRKGAAEVSTSDSSFSVREGQRLSLDTGAQGRIEIAADDTRDEWDGWSHDRDSTIHQASTAVSPDYVNTYETTYNSFYGASDLSNYGTWTDVSSYGYCWIPRVGSDWAPYRTGQWLWVPRAGWTWLAREPWGWAPYHYGRWVFAQGFGWMWVPGFTRYPDPSRFRNYCWRPALVTFFNYPTSRGNYVGWYPLGPGERWRRHDRQLRGGDHSHLQYPAVRNGSERPGDGRMGIRPPSRGVTVVPIEGFNRSDRSRTRPSAPDTEVSDWIRRGARAGLPEIATTPATTAPAIDPDRKSPRRVAVPPGEIISRPVITRNRTSTPPTETQPRERRLISPRSPEFVIDVPTGKTRSAEVPGETDRKVKRAAPASSEQSNPGVRALPKPRTSVAPTVTDDTPRNQTESGSGRREWKPPASESAPGQDAKPRRQPEATGTKEAQPRPHVGTKEQDRPPVRERVEPTRPPETKETRRPPEQRETQRPPEAKETRRPPEPAAAQPSPEPKQPQAQPKEQRRVEPNEGRSERKKP